MKLYCTGSALRARTLWGFRHSEDDVVIPVMDACALVGVNDAGSPVFEYSKAKLHTCIELARQATELWMCQRDDPAGEWQACMLERYLGGFTQAKIYRARQRAVTAIPTVPVPFQPAVAAAYTQKLILDHLVGGVAKPFKKSFGVALANFGLDEWRVLARLGARVEADDEALQTCEPTGTTPHPRLACVASLVGVRSLDLSPEHALADLLALQDMGVLAVGYDPDTAAVVSDYARQTFGVSHAMEPADDVVMPVWPEQQAGSIAPQFRELWLSAWLCCFNAAQGYAYSMPWPTGAPWLPDILPSERDIVALGRLREDALVRGWSVPRPTDAGWLLLAGLPDVPAADVDHVREAVKGAKFQRASMSVCPTCRGALTMRLDRRRAQLTCETCGGKGPADFHHGAGWRFVNHPTWAWCQACGVKVHDATVNAVTGWTSFKCRKCTRTFDD